MKSNFLAEIKPQFNFWVRFYSMNFWYALSAVFGTGLFLIIYFIVTDIETELGKFLYPVVNTSAFFVTILFILIADKMNYSVTKYQINDDKIYFEEGFLNFKSKTISLNDVKEIHLTQNFIQKEFGLSTIKFITSANNSTNIDGIAFKDIENGEEIYKKIKELYSLSSDSILEARPKFDELVRISANSLNRLAFGILISGIIEICHIPHMIMYGDNSTFENFLMTYFVLFLIGFILMVLIATFIDIMNYKNTSYNVYSDHIEFDGGFFNHKHIFVKSENIKEIRLTQNFFQRIVELGAIKFITAANSVNCMSGISFSDIPNSLAVYTKVKQLHQSQT